MVKVGTDGPSLRLDFESGTAADGGFDRYLRVMAAVAGTDDTDPAAATHQERIREWLHSCPWKTATEVATGTSLKRETVDRVLRQLASTGTVRMETGAPAKRRGRSSRAKLWGPIDDPD
jgi:hypothetical protein